MNDYGNDFLAEQERAMERMRQLSRRSKFEATPHKMPPAPNFVKVDNNGSKKASQTEQKRYKHEKQEGTYSPLSGIFPENFGNLLSGSKVNLPNFLKGSPDTALILGLILILYSEKSDRLLLLALLYILI